MRFIGLTIVIGLLLLVTESGAVTQSANLISNPEFELGTSGAPVGWKTRTWGGKGEFSVSDTGYSGSRSVCITSQTGGDIAWQTAVQVKKGGVYRLSGRIKTFDVNPGSGRGALLNVSGVPNTATRAVHGTTGWTQVNSIVRTGNRNSIEINCLFGGWGQSTGKALYDDIRLEEIDLSGYKPKVTIRAQEKRASIHPFIYGQFIEHLGRCIYGGIWAEMLEDRKFYFPIEAEYRPYRDQAQDRAMIFPVVARSPWQIKGEAGLVSMVREDSFVGEHTPLLKSGVAIQQNDLGIVSGEKYTGYIWLKSPDKGNVEVTLLGAEGKSVIKEIGPAYKKYEFSFKALESTDKASLRIGVKQGDVFVGTVSIMPANNIHGMRPDTLELIKKLESPIYRWPGGNFVSGYDWRDGIGDRDRRPPRKNPAWTGVEHNDFGMDEFMIFCELVDTEPLVAVNTGFGDSYSAAQWVEYCNSGADTIGGRWRIENGHTEPYDIKYWCVGNEMFGNWQLGYMQLHHYVQKHNEVAEKMLDVDPELILVGVGEAGNWSRGMLLSCSDHMDWISEHFYCGTMEDVVNHVQQIPNNIRRIAEAHRAYRREQPGLEEKNIRIAMDEWNYWFDHDRYVYGELGTRYRHNDALGVAAGLHEFFRNSDIVVMANYAQTVNVIGCIKTTKTDAFLATTAMPLILYRKHFGTEPVTIEGNHEMLAIDMAAAWTVNHDALTIAVVNPNSSTVKINVDVDGADVAREGKLWTIASADPLAYNDSSNQPVQIVEGHCRFDGSLEVPAYSIQLLKVAAKQTASASR